MAAKLALGRGRVTASTPGPLCVIRLSGSVGRRRVSRISGWVVGVQRPCAVWSAGE
jgi:hypothetical protein